MDYKASCHCGKVACNAMMEMRKIDIAIIEAARRGSRK